MINFKTGSIFSRNSAHKSVEPESSNQILAVWGSPSSGKTLVSVKLAVYLAGMRKNVVLLLCDMTAPPLPCICPSYDLESMKSLGSILAAAYTARQAIELIAHLRNIAPYIIIDCGSVIATDILSSVSLLESDAVLRLVNCDLKSISYLSSQLPLLMEKKWDSDKQYKAASNVKQYEAIENMEQILNGVIFKIPHSEELELQYLAGDLFKELGLKDSRGFRKEIEKISREVFGI